MLFVGDWLLVFICCWSIGILGSLMSLLVGVAVVFLVVIGFVL